ncbi:hypothetical protein [Tenacibaculum phage JQ]|nr:hypothetical protein [Tenacibaculum phage JQ]
MAATKELLINMTLKIPPRDLVGFENEMLARYTLIDLKVLPDTERMHEENASFKKLVKKVKAAQKERDEFINNHNYKYLNDNKPK